jgi:hypothetical protein
MNQGALQCELVFCFQSRDQYKCELPCSVHHHPFMLYQNAVSYKTSPSFSNHSFICIHCFTALFYMFILFLPAKIFVFAKVVFSAYLFSVQSNKRYCHLYITHVHTTGFFIFLWYIKALLKDKTLLFSNIILFLFYCFQASSSMLRDQW